MRTTLSRTEELLLSVVLSTCCPLAALQALEYGNYAETLCYGLVAVAGWLSLRRCFR